MDQTLVRPITILLRSHGTWLDVVKEITARISRREQAGMVRNSAGTDLKNNPTQGSTL